MKSMMLYKSVWGDNTKSTPTFKMYPVNNDCPFNEVLYDPELKVLAIVSKEKKQAFRFVPKINDKGLTTKTKNEFGQMITVQERKMFESFYEYYLEDETDILNFITQFAINSSEFDWQSFIRK